MLYSAHVSWVEVEGSSSAALRDNYMKLHVLPMAKRAFGADAELQSIVVVVGQYWSDEADDAVHVDVVPSTSSKPEWPACVEDETFFYVEDGWWELNDRGEQLVGWRSREGLPQLDDNSSAITAFAAYCQEDCDQEMRIQESHTPYAIVVRSGEGEPTVNIVGRKLQPQWEDRFDVGFTDEDVHVSATPLAESGLGVVGRWAKRLFRKD